MTKPSDDATVIDAIKKVIGRDSEMDEYEEVRTKESLFMNQTRQKMFEYLCQYPAAHFSEMARELQLSTPTLRWHLEKLEEKGFVANKKLGNKIVYFPIGLIGSADVEILSLLHKLKAKKILLLVYNVEGLSQKEIQQRTGINNQTIIGYLKKLEASKLLSSLEDGRYKRYYPTNVLFRLAEEHRQSIRHFRASILKKLTADGVAPNVLRSTDKELQVEIRGGREKRVLVLHTDPFMTIFSKQ